MRTALGLSVLAGLLLGLAGCGSSREDTNGIRPEFYDSPAYQMQHKRDW
jgi:hypothetical protein